MHCRSLALPAGKAPSAMHRLFSHSFVIIRCHLNALIIADDEDEQKIYLASHLPSLRLFPQ